MSTLHPSLPKGLTPEYLSNWIRQNSKESFSEEIKTYYTDDELQSFKDDAVRIGIEIKNLTRLKKRLSMMIDKGVEEFTQVDFLESLGIKALKAKRELIEEEVERGYKVDTVKIFGIPNHDDHSMDFFNAEGVEIPERKRTLSAKEVREYIGLFAFQPESKQA